MLSDFWDEHGRGFNPNQHPTGFDPYLKPHNSINV